MKRLTDRSFVYHDAAETSQPGYIQKKFARIRADQKRAEQAKVVPIQRKAKS